MLLIRCPYCEEDRPELEFRNAGEAHIARSTELAAISDEDFETFFFIRTNPKGIIFERWRHVHGCARFFNAVRNTVSDKFLSTYPAGEPKPDIEKLLAGKLPAAETSAAETPVPAEVAPKKKPVRRAPAKKKDA